MKRLLSYILSISMIVSLLASYAHASPIDKAAHDELVNLACEVFPEYTSIITNSSCNSRSVFLNTECPEIVFSETRSISDTTCLSYIELSDDTCFLALASSSSDLTPSASYSITNSTISGSTTTDTISIVATYSPSSGVVRISGLQYTIYAYSYDRFTNTGSISTQNGATCRGYYPQYVETSSSPAYFYYSLAFPYYGQFIGMHIDLRLQNNQFRLTYSAS